MTKLISKEDSGFIYQKHLKRKYFSRNAMVQGFVFQRKKRGRGMCLKGIAGYANRVMEYQL